MGRRKKGLYREKTGRWIYRTVEEIDGAKIEFRGSSILGPEAAMESWARRREKKLGEMERKKDREEGRILLGDALRGWYDLYKKRERRQGRDRSSQTIRTDRATISAICKDMEGVYLKDLSSDIMQEDLLRLRERGVSQSIINKRWNMYKMFMSHIGRADIMERCTRPYSTRQQEEEKTAYTPTEVEQLVRELKREHIPGLILSSPLQGYRCGGLLTVILYQSLRLGEVLELRVGDIDLERGVMHIQRQYQETRDKISAPKYKSARDVPVMKECRGIIEEAVRGKDQGALLWERWQQDGLYSGHITQGRVREDLTRACKAVGLPVHTVHDLRHDGISRLVDLGVRPQSVSRWAGHKSLTLTLDRYYRGTGQEDPEDLRKIQ